MLSSGNPSEPLLRPPFDVDRFASAVVYAGVCFQNAFRSMLQCWPTLVGSDTVCAAAGTTSYWPLQCWPSLIGSDTGALVNVFDPVLELQCWPRLIGIDTRRDARSAWIPACPFNVGRLASAVKFDETDEKALNVALLQC
jgi:hypothetical protein